jgi:hypothetical protein
MSSVSIASAITAYAIIYFNPFFYLKYNICVYTDTYSVVLDKLLYPSFIGSDIVKV